MFHNVCFFVISSRPPNGMLIYTNKKRHEVMCSCPSFARYRQTPLKERLKELISRLKICYRDIAYTIKRKQKCSVLLLELWRNSISKDSIAMLFLHSPSNSRKQVQKYEEYFIRQKKIPHVREKVYLCNRKKCKYLQKNRMQAV